jgi:hypothetical protein
VPLALADFIVFACDYMLLRILNPQVNNFWILNPEELKI